MQEISVETWEEFEKQLSSIQSQREQRVEKRAPSVIEELLFRGQGDSRWPLETTLDRFFQRKVSVLDYYRIVTEMQAKVETFMNASWSIPSRSKYEAIVNDDYYGFPWGQDAYEYLVYLRHHGFPSPLLDWTASQYVAAFFAFRKPPTDAEAVSIYVYFENPQGYKMSSRSQPSICRGGPNVKAHKRHFLQQSQYTSCIIEKDGMPYYALHEDAIARDDHHQDLLWKYEIPIDERIKVLRKLNKMNINAFSLFGTEESLMETIATTDLELRGRNR